MAGLDSELWGPQFAFSPSVSTGLPAIGVGVKEEGGGGGGGDL